MRPIDHPDAMRPIDRRGAVRPIGYRDAVQSIDHRHARRRLCRIACVALGFLSCACVPPVLASGLDQLHAFLSGTRSAQGSFRQVVVNKDRRTTQTTSGTFAFQRPGKFRWTYDKPFDQLIVGDGEKVFVYDRDLNQVIVRKIDAALGATPAALLAGDNALEKNFTLVAGGEGDGLQYVDATPKVSESQFTRIRLGFANDLPRRMELVDAFGQTTELTFSDVQRNPQLAADSFRFIPPKGADVVGQ